MKKSIDDILEMIQIASDMEVIKCFKVKKGKFIPKIVENEYGRKWVAIGYGDKFDTYIVLAKGGWKLSDYNEENYFESHNVDEQFKGCNVWLEKLSYGSGSDD